MLNSPINSPFEIKLAKSKHLDDIFKLAQSYALPNLTPEFASERGFLVSNFDKQSYKTFIAKNSIFWIVEKSGKLLAFLLVIDPAEQVLDKKLDAKIKEYGINQYLIIKQICTHPEYTSKGIASHLFRAFIEKYSNIPLVTAIVTTPSNQRSIAFHKKWGFKLAFEYEAPDGLARSIWVRA